MAIVNMLSGCTTCLASDDPDCPDCSPQDDPETNDIKTDAADRVQLAWVIYRDALLACASGDPYKLRALAERVASAQEFGESKYVLARMEARR